MKVPDVAPTAAAFLKPALAAPATVAAPTEVNIAPLQTVQSTVEQKTSEGETKEGDWTQEQQRQLEEGLKRFPAVGDKNERYDEHEV
jgi:hypothetical protein